MQELDEERYPGEQESLYHFLRSLQPVIPAEGEDTKLLCYAIQKALRHPLLKRLRHARDLFNNLPKELKEDLSSNLIEHALHHDQGISAGHIDDCDPDFLVKGEASVIRFSSNSGNDGIDIDPLFDDIANSHDIQVHIRAGTLPHLAARKLRLIAGEIESNKPMLSNRHWQSRRLADDHS